MMSAQVLGIDAGALGDVTVDPVKDQAEQEAAKVAAKSSAKAKAKAKSKADDSTTEMAKRWESLLKSNQNEAEEKPEAADAVASDSDESLPGTAPAPSSSAAAAAKAEPKPKAKGTAKRKPKAAAKAKTAQDELSAEAKGLKAFFEEVNEAWPGVGTEMHGILAPVLLEVSANESRDADEAGQENADAKEPASSASAASGSTNGAPASSAIAASGSTTGASQLKNALSKLTGSVVSFLEERHGVCIKFVRKEFTVTCADTRKPLGVLYGLGDTTVRGKCAIRHHKCQCFLTVRAGRWEEAFGTIVGWLAAGRGDVVSPDQHCQDGKELKNSF